MRKSNNVNNEKAKVPISFLLLIIILAFLIRIFNLNYSSPFLDEAQYLVLGKKVLAGHWQESNPFSWVGGMPLFYPTLSAVFGIFGIIGSRFFNVLLGTLSVFLIYEFTKSLVFSSGKKDNQIAGLASAGFLAVLAIPIYLSRLAIYDMLSFTLFLLGLVFFVKGFTIKDPDLWQSENRFALSAIAFSLSFLAKYITLILIPFIIIFGLWHTKRLGKVQFQLYLQYFVIPLVVIVGGYGIWQFNSLLHFQTEQIRASESQILNIVKNFISYSLPLLVPAIFGAVFLYLRNKKIVAVFLIVFALITPIIHILTNNVAASAQHTFLTIIFLLPLAAYAFLFVISKWPFVGSLLLTGALIGSLFYSYSQLRKLETEWPNTNAVMGYLKENTTNHEKILSSQDDITVLALPNLKDENITGIYTFEYKDKTGPEAYKLAFDENYFDFVLLNNHDHEEVEKTARNSLTSHYKQVYNQTPFIVYKLDKT